MVITKTGPEIIEEREYNGGSTCTTRHQDFIVTFGAETRTVRGFRGLDDGQTVRYFLDEQFRASVGRGGKAHRVGLIIDVDADGKVVGPFLNTVVLNRQAWITGFWQAAYDAPAGYGSKHIGTFKGLSN